MNECTCNWTSPIVSQSSTSYHMKGLTLTIFYHIFVCHKFYGIVVELGKRLLENLRSELSERSYEEDRELKRNHETPEVETALRDMEALEECEYLTVYMSWS